jgi:GNAT superfamily N-acetyltransferase
MRIRFRPLSRKTWPDLEALFGENGACGGCWCMFYRRYRPEFDAGKGASNKRALKRLAASDRPSGVLAYDGRTPVGWCAVAPREDFITLARSRVLRPIDDKPAWAITCFFVARTHRGRGLATALAAEAVHYAARRGASLVEGYPIVSRTRVPATFAWVGLPEVFAGAGFNEARQASRARRIMRCEIEPPAPPSDARRARKRTRP